MKHSRPLSSAMRRIFSPVSGLFTLLILLGYAHTEINGARAFRSSMADIPVIAPEGRPVISQESVDLALVLYGIEIPGSAEHPLLDPKLSDRGLTTRATFLEKALVTVGPAAFSSWALLGSTLAHELEIHCEQNFLAIYFMDLAGLDGTGAAERQAYAHELTDAVRFGLDSDDSHLIADTMEYYYPENGGGAPRLMSPAVRNWLAKNVIHGSQGL